MIGALFEGWIRKICTTLWRESGLEVKIVSGLEVKTVVAPGSRTFSRGRRRDLDAELT